jgi:choline monooxygenase
MIPLSDQTGPTRSLLPPVAYRDAGWFDRELSGIFTHRWALAADVAELTSPGDYVATTVGLAPLVVVRGDDGELRAFHNLCRHRGMVLLEGSGNVGRTINCFYHHWRYDLDGALSTVPQRREQFEGLDASQWGLRPASVGVWEGMVFVHPDPDPPPLAHSLDGVREHVGSHRPGELRQLAVVRIEAKCNWKLFVENHIDVYHLWYLHAESLGDFDHTRFEYHQVGPNWASYEPLRRPDLAAAALTTGTVTIAHLDERDRLGIGAHMMFPNLLMATAAEFFATYEARPVAPDRTVIELRIRGEAAADPEALLASIRSFIAEDVLACEAVQRGVGSPAFEVGPLARDLEAPITAFHTCLLDRLGAA